MALVRGCRREPGRCRRRPLAGCPAVAANGWRGVPEPAWPPALHGRRWQWFHRPGRRQRGQLAAPTAARAKRPRPALAPWRTGPGPSAHQARCWAGASGRPRCPRGSSRRWNPGCLTASADEKPAGQAGLRAVAPRPPGLHPGPPCPAGPAGAGPGHRARAAPRRSPAQRPDAPLWQR